MKTFSIRATETVEYYLEVEAETEEEASAIAWEKLRDADIDNDWVTETNLEVWQVTTTLV
jgi:hypothetical protein